MRCSVVSIRLTVYKTQSVARTPVAVSTNANECVALLRVKPFQSCNDRVSVVDLATDDLPPITRGFMDAWRTCTYAYSVKVL